MDYFCKKCNTSISIASILDAALSPNETVVPIKCPTCHHHYYACQICYFISPRRFNATRHYKNVHISKATPTADAFTGPSNGNTEKMDVSFHASCNCLQDCNSSDNEDDEVGDMDITSHSSAASSEVSGL